MDFLLYAITDAIVDGYFPVLDAIEDEIDEIQDAVIARPTTWTLERLFTLKRELISLRRAISPSREIFNQLTNRDQALIAADHIVYFRDVYDHLIRVTDELDTDRELVGGTLEVYLSTVNNNLSTIMKRLTGVTVILAGIGAVAGIFGMSEAAVRAVDGRGQRLLADHRDRGDRRRDHRVLPAPDRLDLGITLAGGHNVLRTTPSRSSPASPWGARPPGPRRRPRAAPP